MMLFRMLETVFAVAGMLCGIGVIWKSAKNSGNNKTFEDRITFRQLTAGMWAALAAHGVCSLVVHSDPWRRVLDASVAIMMILCLCAMHFADTRRAAKGLPIV